MDINNKARNRKIFRMGFLILLIFIIRVFSVNAQWIENIYSTHIYVFFSLLLRIIFGWIPFSVGDIFYFLVIVWFIWKAWQFLNKLFKRKINKNWFKRAGYKLLISAMVVYIIFNITWGLNYNRKSIAGQLNLQVLKKDTAALKIIQILLLQKVNESKQALINQHVTYPSNKELFQRAFMCYQQSEKMYPFLNYKNVSVKSSLYRWWGNYFGFTGYYNPFSGEAQVNTSVPKFILPYTTTHEIAHQLGFAKEEEANFAGYLAATSSADTLFHYSAYLDLFVYANRELFFVDSLSAKNAAKQLLPEVKADIKEWREFLLSHKNPIEPFIRWAYGSYLKANQQPKGLNSYDEVIADLIAFYKKKGRI
ncbi:MAG: DUF3810 domain-containing protein [Bacteroidota bacterium]|nr:DUF3810 domain-containing protein [Bacteroidota bacterium]